MTVNILIGLITAVFASQGFWALIVHLIQRKDNKKNKSDEMIQNQNDMLLGLGHDRIMFLGNKYLNQGFISVSDYDDLNTYLYKPYTKLGGNGSATALMNKIEQLPNKPKEEE